MSTSTPWSRREFISRSAAAGAGLLAGQAAFGAADSAEESARPALIAITLDCEMSHGYPRPEDTHWDYEKGNLDDMTKAYAVEAARRVKAHGGRMHFFALGRTLEQESVDWLKGILADGHKVGNHTYDHINFWASTVPRAQFRFERAPWLVEGKSLPQVLRENILMTTEAFKARLGVAPDGFRTPGGHRTGLEGREDLQKLVLGCGFSWVSSKVPAFPRNPTAQRPDRKIFEGIAAVWPKNQPFVYPTGLIEVPITPITDTNAFRAFGWNLDEFVECTRLEVQAAIDHGAVCSFGSHPSVLAVVDPEFRTIEAICELTKRAGAKARFADLDAIARRAASHT